MNDDPLEMLKQLESRETSALRHSVHDLKRQIGGEKLKELLQPELEESDRRFENWVEASDGEWVVGQVNEKTTGPSVEQFFEGWGLATEQYGAEAMWFGSPEDYLLDMEGPMSEQFAIVRFGVNPTDIVQLNFKEADLSTLPFDPNPDFDADQVLAVEEQNNNGQTITYVSHEYQDTNEGYEARHTLFFPAECPDEVVTSGPELMAVEFTNFSRIFIRTLNNSIEDGSNEIPIPENEFHWPDGEKIPETAIERMEHESACRVHDVLTEKLCE